MCRYIGGYNTVLTFSTAEGKSSLSTSLFEWLTKLRSVEPSGLITLLGTSVLACLKKHYNHLVNNTFCLY